MCYFIHQHIIYVEKKCMCLSSYYPVHRVREEGVGCKVVRQVSSAPDRGGVRVAIVTRDVTAGGAQFTCRCLLE